MNLPLEIDLYLSDNLPSMSGGGPEEIVNNMKNRMYKYLVSSRKSPIPVVLQFDSTLNTKTNNPYSLYINMGSVKVIFGLRNHPEYNKMLNLPEQLILRCFDNLLDEEFEAFIKKWKKDKHTFDKYIIDIFLYGKIYDNRNNLICKYFLTRKYDDYSKVAVLNQNDTIKLYISLLNFLKYLKKENIIYRNLKFSNIGYQKEPNGDVQLVILDYDNATLIRPGDDYFESFNFTGCGNKLCSGDIVPYYVAHDYFYSNPDWKKRLDKLYSSGLAEITMSLFFRYNDQFNHVYKLFSGLASLGPCLHYYHLMAIFDSRDKHQNIINTINQMDNKFSSMNPILEKELYLIVLNLISKDYELIKYPGQILDKIMECLASNKDFQEENEPLPIHPIGSLPPYKPSPTQIENLFSDSRTGMVDRMISAVDRQLAIDESEVTEDVEAPQVAKVTTIVGGSKEEIEFRNKYLKYKLKYINLLKNKK